MAKEKEYGPTLWLYEKNGRFGRFLHTANFTEDQLRTLSEMHNLVEEGWQLVINYFSPEKQTEMRDKAIARGKSGDFVPAANIKAVPPRVNKVEEPNFI